MNESKQWTAYNLTTVLFLEHAKRSSKAKVEFTADKRKYEVNLIAMSQRNVATGVTRSVQRIKTG